MVNSVTAFKRIQLGEVKTWQLNYPVQKLLEVLITWRSESMVKTSVDNYQKFVPFMVTISQCHSK